MSTDQNDPAAWLRALGALVTTAGMSVADARERMKAFVPLLTYEFDRRVFCHASLIFTARRCKFFPNFAELCEHLAAWAKDNPPPPSRVPLPAPTARSNAESFEISEQSWRDLTAADVRAKVTEVQRRHGGTMRDTFGRILAHGVNKFAPHHLPLIPPQWQDTAP